MRLNLVEEQDDDTVEIIFSSDGSSVFHYPSDDAGTFGLEDGDSTVVSFSLGDLDRLIVALQKLKEVVDD